MLLYSIPCLSSIFPKERNEIKNSECACFTFSFAKYVSKQPVSFSFSLHYLKLVKRRNYAMQPAGSSTYEFERASERARWFAGDFFLHAHTHVFSFSVTRVKKTKKLYMLTRYSSLCT